MESERQIRDTIRALRKFKGHDNLDFNSLQKEYGENWAVIFDDLRSHKVVSSPVDGKVHVNQNYIAPVLRHYKNILKNYNRLKWISLRSWAALIISIIGLIISVLKEIIWKYGERDPIF